MSWLPNPFKSLRLSGDQDSLSDAAAAAIGHQLRGVAAFLAPPPTPSPPDITDHHSSDSPSPMLAGIRSDLEEISGSLKAVIGISKLASSFLPRNEEERDEIRVGVTDEVVDFVTEISEFPECWTDFPLSLHSHHFSMNKAQAEHISVIERIVPSLADLRIKLSSEMSERQFWMIYFVLLIPRLKDRSLILLSTPEVAEARNMLLTMLRNRRNSLTLESKKFNQKGFGENNSDEQKDLTCRVGTSRRFSEEEDADTASVDAHGLLQNEGNIAFSDPEDGVGSCSSDGSSEWVRLNRNAEIGGGRLCSRNSDSEGVESSDWLIIHKLDYFN